MKALIWKEWREQRILLLFAIGLLLCITLINVGYLNTPLQTTEEHMRRLDSVYYSNLFLGWVILPSLFAFILGANPFSKEFANNTQDFLIQRPVSTAKIYWLKFSFGIVMLLLVIQICHWVLYVSPDSFQMQISAPDFQYPTPLIMFYLLSALIYFSVFFSSLLVKKELPAMVFAPIAVVIGLLYILPLYLILFIILPPQQLQFLLSGIGDDITFYYFPTAILLASFALFGFLIWQKAISKGVKSTKIFFTVTGIIFAIYFVAHTILNISTGLELSQALKQAKANGIKMTLEEIIPPPVPDEQNAALVYQDVFNLVDKLREKHKDEWEYMPYESKNKVLEELTVEQKNNITKLLLEDNDFMKFYSLIEEAVNFPKCRFDLNYEEGSAMSLPHLQKIRTLTGLVAARTYILTEENRYKEAWESFLVGIKIGESLKDEPLLLSQLVRIAANGITAESLRPILSIFPEEISINDYEELILEINNKEKKLTKGLEGEFFGIWGFRKLLKGDVKVLELDSGDRFFIFSRIYASYPLKPSLKQDYVFYINHLTESSSLSHIPYYQAKNKFRELDNKVEAFRSKYIVSGFVLPSLSHANIRQVENNARLDGLKIACALKIYKISNGYYPENLTALVPNILAELPVDEFTGEGFIYRKQGKGFIVYSLGPNEKDDGGISLKKNNERSGQKGYDKEAYDIEWKCEE